MSISELLKSIKEKIKGIKDNVLAAYDIIEKAGYDTKNKKVEELPSVVSKAVNKATMISRGGELGDSTLFIDFDGTPLFAYEPEEILALEELPIPYTSHERLTFVKWNYTLEEIKERVQVFGCIDVGALYEPTDGWGEMEIEIGGTIPQFTPHFRMWLQEEGVLTMDWGDGTIEEYNGMDLDVRHTYEEVGKYLVRFISTTSYRGLYTYNDTKALVVGRFVFPTNAISVGSNPNGMSGGNKPEENNAKYKDPQCLAYTMVETLVIPKECYITSDNNGSGLTHMYRLKSIVAYSSGVWRGSDLSFPSCRYFSIRERNFRYGGAYDMGGWFKYARSHFWGYISAVQRVVPYSLTFPHPNLERIVGGIEVKTTNSNYQLTFESIKKLPKVLATSYWVNYGISNLYNCKEYQQPTDVYPHVEYLNNNILIKDYNCVFTTGCGNYYCLFQNNTSLQTLSLYASGTVVRTIKASALLNCYSLKELHLVYFEEEDTPIVTLANINAFSGCPSDLKIYVPAELVDAYKTATNWSTYADQIFAEPEVEPTE